MLRFLFIIPTILFAASLAARTIVAGKNQAITTLRKAIELAKDGDTILLQAGTYKEGNLVITKSIT